MSEVHVICSECGEVLRSEDDRMTHEGSNFCKQCQSKLWAWKVVEDALSTVEAFARDTLMLIDYQALMQIHKLLRKHNDGGAR